VLLKNCLLLKLIARIVFVKKQILQLSN